MDAKKKVAVPHYPLHGAFACLSDQSERSVLRRGWWTTVQASEVAGVATCVLIEPDEQEDGDEGHDNYDADYTGDAGGDSQPGSHRLDQCGGCERDQTGRTRGLEGQAGGSQDRRGTRGEVESIDKSFRAHCPLLPALLGSLTQS